MVAWKKIILLLIPFVLLTDAQAGLVGWLTSNTRSWSFVQQTGGIRISEPREIDGKLVLPVEYDATGVSGVTQRPTRMNSSLVVRKIQTNRTNHGQLVIRIVTQIAERDSDPGKIHYAELADLPPGAYKVYYGEAGDSEKMLGQIRVK